MCMISIALHHTREWAHTGRLSTFKGTIHCYKKPEMVHKIDLVSKNKNIQNGGEWSVKSPSGPVANNGVDPFRICAMKGQLAFWQAKLLFSILLMSLWKASFSTSCTSIFNPCPAIKCPALASWQAMLHFLFPSTTFISFPFHKGRLAFQWTTLPCSIPALP